VTLTLFNKGKDHYFLPMIPNLKKITHTHLNIKMLYLAHDKYLITSPLHFKLTLHYLIMIIMIISIVSIITIHYFNMLRFLIIPGGAPNFSCWFSLNANGMKILIVGELSLNTDRPIVVTV